MASKTYVRTTHCFGDAPGARKAAWEFMRRCEVRGVDAGYPDHGTGEWTVRTRIRQNPHGNRVAVEGCDRCDCGAKYWERDRCHSCGAAHPELATAQEPQRAALALACYACDTKVTPAQHAAVAARESALATDASVPYRDVVGGGFHSPRPKNVGPAGIVVCPECHRKGLEMVFCGECEECLAGIWCREVPCPDDEEEPCARCVGE